MLKSGLFLFLALATLLPFSARSEDMPATAPVKEEQPKDEEKPIQHSPILPVKIKPVQEGADGVSKAAPNIEQAAEIDPDTLALYVSQGDGGLGPDLWKGVPRQEIIDGFAKLPVPEFSPAERELTLRLLLTKAAVELSNAEKPSPDVFTARMTKLIELGAFKEAMALNEKLESPASTEAAALAGMQAFIANGQIAIACLEQKALSKDLKKEAPFWAHLDKFCQTYIKTEGGSGDVSQSLMHAALAYSQNEKTLAPAQFEDINKISLVELMVLAKSGALDRGKWSVATASKISPSAVAFLLAMEPTQSSQKLSLLTLAVAHGLKTPDDLRAAYAEFPKATGEWAAIVNGSAKLASATDKPAALKAMLASAEAVSPAAYTPFADTLAEITPAAPFTATDAMFVLKVMIAAQHELPVAWVNFAYGTLNTEESGESALLKIWDGTAVDTKKAGDKAPAKAESKKGKISPEIAYSRVLQDFLSDKPTPEGRPAYTYDNFLSLTGSSNYVMPSGDLTESLKRAAASKHLGKTLMYGLQILNGQQADQIHPATLFQVLKAYKTAGLSEETASLAHEALTGLTKEKKEN